MYTDIVSLIRGALLENGCDESLLGDFDSHSTISLDFEKHPSMFISVDDNYVWIWSRLCEVSDSIMQYKASALLEKMIEGCQFSITGQLHISLNEGYIELKGMVHPNFLENSSRFAEALDEFFTQQEAFLGIIR
ncbi:hypothetical protein [Erwinia sp. ErVv1]|uniref:InvB/SpaK family type III secretion system chaperone n=1 Tax=Erwinia sp. ErVv1 TaxID=1603299 RepID=UPI0008326D33|nr:hypothetical protein [Erwinia sp. ErVv1]